MYAFSDWLLPRYVFGELTVGAVSCVRDFISFISLFFLFILIRLFSQGIHFHVVSNTDSLQE